MKKHRVVSLVLAMLVAVSSMSSVILNVFAADYTQNQLQNSHKDVYAGNDFNGLYEFELYNPYNIDVKDDNADYSYWHFIDSSKKSTYALITFATLDGESITWNVKPCKNNQHFAVITPSSWKLMDGVSYSAEGGNFVLSHSGRHIGAGKVNVGATVDSYYYEITPHEYYERTVDEYYERTVDEYYERTVDEYYERSVDEYYERTVTNYFERPVYEIYNRYAQKYLVPVFTRKVNSETGTLVTRLTYSDNTKNAKPVNGGAFKNGHTYVAVDVAKASKEGGVNYIIADSSKNNGKKTPSQYNKPIDYKYNVSIKDGKLIISFDEQLVSASVGAYVVTNPNNFPGNAPKHYDNSVVLDLPKNNGIVYLYTHISSVNWYAGENIYEFLEWRYDDSRTVYDENYTLIDTKTGDYTFVETKYGDYKLVKTEYGNYELVNTEYGEYELVKTEYGNYELVNTEYGDYELVNTEYEKNKRKVSYDGDLILTVNGEEKPLNEELVLVPGEYTFTVSSANNDFAPVSKVVTILPGENDSINFDILYVLDDVTLDTVEHKSDKDATVHESDKTATRHEKDLESIVHESDKTANRHEKDLEATDVYSDKESEKIYNEEYLLKGDIKLGNSEDPFGKYAVRLN